MSNDIPGSADHDRPAPTGAGSNAYPSRQNPFDQQASDHRSFGRQASAGGRTPHRADPDADCPRSSENDPLIRSAGSRGSAETGRTAVDHPSVVPTPIPPGQGPPGGPDAVLLRRPVPPRPMPQQTYQPGYQQTWHGQQQPHWNTGQLPFSGPSAATHRRTDRRIGAVGAAGPPRSRPPWCSRSAPGSAAGSWGPTCAPAAPHRHCAATASHSLTQATTSAADRRRLGRQHRSSRHGRIAERGLHPGHLALVGG